MTPAAIARASPAGSAIVQPGLHHESQRALSELPRSSHSRRDRRTLVQRLDDMAAILSMAGKRPHGAPGFDPQAR